MPLVARLLSLLLLLLACAACELELGVGVDVRRDGSGTLAVSVAADRELLDEAQAAGAAPLDDLATAGAQLGGWDVDDADSPERRVVTLSTSFDDPAEFADVTAQLAGALSADEVQLLSPLRLEVLDRQVRLGGRASLEPTAAVRDSGLSPRQVVRRLRRAEALTYTITATFPGPVVAAPGATVEGDTATWALQPGDSVQLDAVAERPPAPVWRIVAGGAVGGFVAGCILLLWSRRRRRVPDR